MAMLSLPYILGYVNDFLYTKDLKKVHGSRNNNFDLGQLQLILNI